MPAKRKQPKSKKKRERSTSVPGRQLSLPAGFSADGKTIVSLRDVLSPRTPTLELNQLSLAQQASLTAERIRRQRKYKMGMVGFGVLDKKTAIEQVNAQTPVGRTLVEIENRTLRMLIEKGRGASRTTPTRGKP